RNRRRARKQLVAVVRRVDDNAVGQRERRAAHSTRGCGWDRTEAHSVRRSITMNRGPFALIVATLFFAGIAHAESAGTVTCKDGTTATAGRGACHGHGGVDKGTSKTQTTSAGDTGATVTCTDGATSKAGRGACRGHGGVAKSPAAESNAPAPAPPA